MPVGTVRFAKGARIFTDGSAKFSGQTFAVASCAVVQIDERGIERAVQVALPRCWPQSAVAAEMYAVMVALDILDRGTDDGERHMQCSIRLVADCSAVVSVWHKGSKG